VSATRVRAEVGEDLRAQGRGEVDYEVSD
jgi:hypothetical protein